MIKNRSISRLNGEKGDNNVLISTRGRYAVRILADMAKYGSGGVVPLKEIAVRQDISLKYIERIMSSLKEANLVESVHGTLGGYKLTKKPEKYNLWEILVAAEGDLAPVACLQSGSEPCKRSEECKTVRIWSEYYEVTKRFFENVILTEVT